MRGNKDLFVVKTGRDLQLYKVQTPASSLHFFNILDSDRNSSLTGTSQIMEHLILLLLLGLFKYSHLQITVTIQPLSSSVSLTEQIISSLDNCPKGQSIKTSCSNNTELAFCLKKTGQDNKPQLKFTFQTAQSAYPCIQVKGVNNNDGICNKCRWNNGCKQSCSYTMPSPVSTINIQFTDPSCSPSYTPTTSSSTVFETGSSLDFYEEPKSWIEALKICYKGKSTLVEIVNQTVYDEVIDLLEGEVDFKNGLWVGLERSIFGSDLNWRWTSGSKVIYPTWNSSFPVDRFNNHCGKIIWINDSNTIQLLDGKCHEELPFICQDRE